MKPKKTDCVNEYFPTLMKCKEYFKNDDMLHARLCYYELNDILQRKLDKFVKENNKDDEFYEMKKNFIYDEFNTIIDCLTYEELYTLSGHKGWITTDCED